jgi:2-desacetyl-2-hydroxyethyl bacteriochlorophyllide A dehydrogenase
MRTIVCEKPGQLVLTDTKEPEVKQGYSIIRIRKIGICGTDLHAFEGTQPYFSYPRILGHELAGEIVQTDDDSFEPGEKVTILPYYSCGYCVACRTGKTNCCVRIQVCGVHTDGGMREYFSVPTSSLVHSDGLTAEQLALIEPLAIGAHGIKRASVTENEFVLVIGAGPIGLGTMEFARIAGAKLVVMDVNEQRLQFCKTALGISNTINPIQDNAAERLAEITNGDMANVVIDATGNLPAITNGFQFIAHGGRYVLIGLQKGDISFSHPEFHKREATLMSSRNAVRSDFDYVIHMITEQKINPLKFITDRIAFDELTTKFDPLLDPANAVIKVIVSID